MNILDAVLRERDKKFARWKAVPRDIQTGARATENPATSLLKTLQKPRAFESSLKSLMIKSPRTDVLTTVQKRAVKTC